MPVAVAYLIFMLAMKYPDFCFLLLIFLTQQQHQTVQVFEFGPF
jgi:hypothetical protein